jgi:hypothetical protein
VKVGRGGVFGIVGGIVKWGYRRLGHKWEGGWRGTGEHGKKEGRKKKGRQSESKAWGKIKRETCNFDLFLRSLDRAGEINTDEAELKGILAVRSPLDLTHAFDFQDSESIYLAFRAADYFPHPSPSVVLFSPPRSTIITSAHSVLLHHLHT